jgi:hypothetical protein
MIEGRIKHLEKEHTRLDNEVDTLERTGKFTDTQLHNLKKQKLAVLDELSRLRREQYEENQRVGYGDDH